VTPASRGAKPPDSFSGDTKSIPEQAPLPSERSTPSAPRSPITKDLVTNSRPLSQVRAPQKRTSRNVPPLAIAPTSLPADASLSPTDGTPRSADRRKRSQPRVKAAPGPGIATDLSPHTTRSGPKSSPRPAKDTPPHIPATPVVSLDLHRDTDALCDATGSRPPARLDWAGDDDESLPDLGDWGISVATISGYNGSEISPIIVDGLKPLPEALPKAFSPPVGPVDFANSIRPVDNAEESGRVLNDTPKADTKTVRSSTTFSVEHRAFPFERGNPRTRARARAPRSAKGTFGSTTAETSGGHNYNAEATSRDARSGPSSSGPRTEWKATSKHRQPRERVDGVNLPESPAKGDNLMCGPSKDRAVAIAAVVPAPNAEVGGAQPPGKHAGETSAKAEPEMRKNLPDLDRLPGLEASIHAPRRNPVDPPNCDPDQPSVFSTGSNDDTRSKTEGYSDRRPRVGGFAIPLPQRLARPGPSTANFTHAHGGYHTRTHSAPPPELISSRTPLARRPIITEGAISQLAKAINKTSLSSQVSTIAK
jgi:hypothetical protein